MLELFPYQQEGVEILVRDRFKILADQPGLGKTVQALLAADRLGSTSTLVVCPHVSIPIWDEEARKWGLGEVCRIEGKPLRRRELLASPAKIKVMNYELVTRHIDDLMKSSWDVIVFDEAHRIKNRQAQRTKAVYKIAKGAKAIFHITATPIINRPDELWSLLHILDPKRFSSYWRFVQTYCQMEYNGFAWSAGDLLDAESFREMLRPFILRRLKSEVGDLPEKTIRQIWVPLTGDHLTAYRQMKADFFAEIADGEIVTAATAATKILRLKQIAIHPRLTLDDDGTWEISGPKIDALLELLEDFEGEPVVIFSQFLRAVNPLSRLLRRKKIPHGVISGETPHAERDRLRDEFQNGRLPVMLLTSQTGGESITLTAAAVAIFLDKRWAPAHNEQAQDRVHRISQTRDVQIFEILATKTIEGYIERVLGTKESTIAEVLDPITVLQSGWDG